jgi:tRNA-dihydrouridine synthase 1
VEPIVDAIDLNLGCPQRIAHSGHYGSFLLDDVDRPLVLDMIRTLAQTLTIPVFAKIRLLSTTEKTIELVTQLRDAGASLVAIHARHRVNLVGRTGQGARDGPALLDEVAKVRAAVPGVRLISNGNVRTWEDVVANMELTGADGIMSAEGILDDPAIFFPGRSSNLTTTGGAIAAVAAGSASGNVAAASLSEGGLSEEERRVRKLTKKLREVERLEAAALLREGGSASLTKEEALKVAQKAETVAELAKAEKALKKLRKKRKLSDGTESAGSTAAAPRVASAPPVAEPAEPPHTLSLAPQPLAQKPSPLQLAREYIELTKTHPVPLKTLVFHVRRMAKEPLTHFQLFSDVLEAKDAATVHAAVRQALDYEVNGFTPDPDKAKKERAAWELKKWREATRKRFEERMVRKALRSGLPHGHFLSQGAKVPTWQDLAELKAMDPAAAWSQWTSLHGQHCWAMHMDPGGCTRERTCAFLHVDLPKVPMDTSADHWG